MSAQELRVLRTPDMAEDGPGQTVSVAEVAAAMGVSVRTVRRYIQNGTIPADRVTTQQGVEWRIPAGAVMAAATVRTGPDSGHDRAAVAADVPGQPRPVTEGGQRGRGDDRTLLRALDLLADRDRRVEDLERERAELYGRLGFYQARVQMLEETVKALQPAPASQVAGEMTPSPSEGENGAHSSAQQVHFGQGSPERPLEGPKSEAAGETTARTAEGANGAGQTPGRPPWWQFWKWGGQPA